MQELLLLLDPIFVAPYRWLGMAHPAGGYVLGTAVLALLTILPGLVTLRLARALHRKRLHALSDDMRRYHHLGEAALARGSKADFKAVNKQAHEAFGYHFSLNGAFFVASLWPVPLALAWMQLRFAAVSPELPFSLPLLGQAPGFVFWFLLCYIPLRMLCSRALG